MVNVRKLTMLAAAAVLLIGCQVISMSERRELPTWCPQGTCPGVPAIEERQGILGATDWCTWVLVDGQRALALWPSGFTAVIDPLVIYGPNGGEVAREGETISVVMVGPERLDGATECGLQSKVELYFDLTDD